MIYNRIIINCVLKPLLKYFYVHDDYMIQLHCKKILAGYRKYILVQVNQETVMLKKCNAKSFFNTLLNSSTLHNLEF